MDEKVCEKGFTIYNIDEKHNLALTLLTISFSLIAFLSTFQYVYTMQGHF